MGLDMYLEGSFSTRAYTQPTDQDYADMREGKKVTIEKSSALEDALDAIGFQDAPIDHAYNHMTYVFPLLTWRKANAIHKFFVDEVQNGNDNCERYWVSLENLKELLTRINEILKIEDKEERITKASKILPTDNEGCFFGSLDYGDWYFQDLERTKNTLDKLFAYEKKMSGTGKCFDNFYYQSSW